MKIAAIRVSAKTTYAKVVEGDAELIDSLFAADHHVHPHKACLPATFFYVTYRHRMTFHVYKLTFLSAHHRYWITPYGSYLHVYTIVSLIGTAFAFTKVRQPARVLSVPT